MSSRSPISGGGATERATHDEALFEAQDLLRELVACTMRDGKDLPEPSLPFDWHELVVPPVMIALKAALNEDFRETGPSQRGLSRKLGITEGEVGRMLNPDLATKATAIDLSMHRLGKRVIVSVSGMSP